jgi:endogenous inhibitor of DNA gyrase (YacG/DUF329 family)
MNGMPERADHPPTKRCPICGKPSTERFRPFCTRRCADVDLNRWLGAVPVKDEEDEDGASKREEES